MRLILLSAFALLAACNNAGDVTEPGATTDNQIHTETLPIAGGPCSYEESVIEATVTEADEDGATFTGPDGEFFVSSEYVSPVPAVGETLTLKRELILTGTCTPEIYSAVK